MAKKSIWGVILLVLLAVVLLFAYYNKQVFVDMIAKSPLLWAVYSHIVWQVEERTLLGLFYANIFGSIFFIAVPAELIFLYYSLLDYNPGVLALVALAGSFFGIVVNYYAGMLFGERLLKYFKGYKRLKSLNDRYAGAVLFFGNIIIFPAELFSVIVGATRYPFKKYIVYSLLGRFLKFFILIIGKDAFLSYVLPWIRSVIT